MILITGATGFIGRSLTARLDRSGIDYRPHHGRINNPLSLREQLQDIETVIHLAGSENRGRNRLLRHVDVEGTERLVEEAERAGVRHLIVPSRIGADPNAVQPLLRAKGEVERLVQRSRIPYTILRSASLYGRGDRYFEIILSLSKWTWPILWLPGGGHAATQPLWIEDFVRCLTITLDRPDLVGKVLTIAGEERYSYRTLAERLLDVTGQHRLIVPVPLAFMPILTTLLFRWWYWPPFTRFHADRFFVPEVANHDTILRTFGFRPTPIGESIAYLRGVNLRSRLFRR